MASENTTYCHFEDLRPGDCLAFGPVDFVGGIVSLATWPPWPFYRRMAHFALVADYDGIPCVYESTSDPELGDCRDARKIITGVQVHGLMHRMTVHAARGGRAWRLRPYPILLPEPEQIESVCRALLGTGYDFRGALAARSYFGGALKWLREQNPDADDLLFCSEFVLAVYQVLGLLPLSIPTERFHPKAAARLLVERAACRPPQEIRL